MFRLSQRIAHFCHALQPRGLDGLVYDNNINHVEKVEFGVENGRPILPVDHRFHTTVK
jgi:hypothetical protein